MPRIISFAWTTAAFRAQRKTVTRRDWDARCAQSFREGEVLQAWDKSSRVPGAKRIGTIRLTQAPYLENTINMPTEDYEGEGFKFYDEYPDLKPKKWAGYRMYYLFREWASEGRDMWVVRFEVLEVYEPLVIPEPTPQMERLI